MRKNKENDFAHKFRLLNSQECTDDINWSMSSSSGEEDYSNIMFCNRTNHRRYNKRKRRRKPCNVSNLDITVIDTTSKRTGAKSPVLCDKTSVLLSPVLGVKFSQRSPILVPRSSQNSPILHRNSMKVNRKLFNYNGVSVSSHVIGSKISKIFKNGISNSCDNLVKVTEISDTSDKLSESSKHNIYRNVKSFFDSNFTSDNASQNSISDVTTPKDSIQSDEVEISSGTPDNESASIQKFIIKSSSGEKFQKEAEKKIKYKKDGLAYRLNGMLKKQNASHSLWRHEKFLADNSNFIIPQEEHMTFRVKNTECEYGCTVLNAVDGDDFSYSIVINNVYLAEKIQCDSIVKIYKPYTIIDHGSHKVMLNVCKYDHLVMKIRENL